jgi:hypothetical protein
VALIRATTPDEARVAADEALTKCDEGTGDAYLQANWCFVASEIRKTADCCRQAGAHHIGWGLVDAPVEGSNIFAPRCQR